MAGQIISPQSWSIFRVMIYERLLVGLVTSKINIGHITFKKIKVLYIALLCSMSKNTFGTRNGYSKTYFFIFNKNYFIFLM
jgi:hypothetical protein